MSPWLTTFLAEIVNFAVLAGGLSWLFFTPVRHAIAERRSRITGIEQQAREQLAQAQRTQSEIDAARAKLQHELADLRSRELSAAQQQAAQLLEDARRTAREELSAARARVVQLGAQEQNDLARAAVDLAMDTLAHLFATIEGVTLEAILADAALAQWTQLPAMPNGASISVESGRDLDDDLRARLTQVGAAVGGRVEFHAVPDLGPGIRIATPAGLVDTTARGLVRFARESFAAQLEQLQRGESDVTRRA